MIDPQRYLVRRHAAWAKRTRGLVAQALVIEARAELMGASDALACQADDLANAGDAEDWARAIQAAGQPVVRED